MNKIKKLLAEEPVRMYLYGVVAAVVALLVGVGVITAAVAPLILAVAAAALAVPAVETARAKVKPLAKLEASE